MFTLNSHGSQRDSTHINTDSLRDLNTKTKIETVIFVFTSPVVPY